MSDGTTVSPEGAAIVIDPSTSKPLAPAPAGNKPPAPEEKPEWLDARLDQRARAERNALLKELGITDVDAAKKAIASAKVTEEAQKSADQRAVEAAARAERAEQALKTKDEALGLYAKNQLAGLNDAQRNAVMAVAGDDAALQLKTLEALRPTWAGAQTVTTQAETTKAVVTDTAPAPSAPKGGTVTTSPVDHKAIHAEIAKTNPVAAARYALKHRVFE